MVKKAIEDTNPCYSLRENGSALEVSFPKYVLVSSYHENKKAKSSCLLFCLFVLFVCLFVFVFCFL